MRIYHELWTGDLLATSFIISIGTARYEMQPRPSFECGKARQSGVVMSGDERRREVIDRSIMLRATWAPDSVA